MVIQDKLLQKLRNGGVCSQYATWESPLATGERAGSRDRGVGRLRGLFGKMVGFCPDGFYFSEEA